MSGKDWRPFGRFHTTVRARAATEQEHSEIWPEAQAYNSHWRDYQKIVKRRIPLVILTRE